MTGQESNDVPRKQRHARNPVSAKNDDILQV